MNYWAPRFWLGGLLCSLLTNLYRLQQAHAATCLRVSSANIRSFATEVLREMDDGTRQTAVDALQDLVDLVIPVSMLGVVEVSPIIVGAAGTFTSLLGAASLLRTQK